MSCQPWLVILLFKCGKLLPLANAALITKQIDFDGLKAKLRNYQAMPNNCPGMLKIAEKFIIQGNVYNGRQASNCKCRHAT